MRKIFFHTYHRLLLLLGNTIIGKTKWYKDTVYEEAQWIIGNRPWRKKLT